MKNNFTVTFFDYVSVTPVLGGKLYCILQIISAATPLKIKEKICIDTHFKNSIPLF